MMMPILDQSPAHHHHHAFYHQQHLPEHIGKMQLTLILPNGVPSVLSVDANTPMMDLLVQAASLNKLNPSGYSLVVLDSNQHVIHFKPNQTVGQIVRNCQLPQINGASMISLLPKETPPINVPAKSRTQPFEITVRLQVNLPDGQKILLRVDPTLPLFEIKERICKQKKYTNSSRYTLCLPNKLDRPLLLGLSLAECKTNELNLMYLKSDLRGPTHQIQSFDRLYRARSESQPPREATQEVQNIQQESTDSKQRPASAQLNPIRPTHQVTSHTSMHAYWNDPNFDTQSQTSNCSSTTKKRQAPKPPGYISPNLHDQQIIYLQPLEHHQSQESLTESLNGTKQKRKAPLVATTTETVVDIEPTSHPASEEQPSANSETVQTSQTTTQNIRESSPTPVYSQVQKPKESSRVESPPPADSQRENIVSKSPANYSVSEIVQAGIAEPPSVVVGKASKRSSSTEGLLKIITDHQARTAAPLETSDKSTEDLSYFRVAKSRHGKFETDSQGFVSDADGTAVDNDVVPKAPTPIQLEVTERTTHISVTVESDRKQLITRASPVPPATSNSPTTVSPKPSGKTITEYRTIRRMGADGETTTTTTVRTETIPPASPVEQIEPSTTDEKL